MKASTKETLKAACRLIGICYYKEDIKDLETMKRLSEAMTALCMAIDPTDKEVEHIRCWDDRMKISFESNEEE